MEDLDHIQPDGGDSVRISALMRVIIRAAENYNLAVGVDWQAKNIKILEVLAQAAHASRITIFQLDPKSAPLPGLVSKLTWPLEVNSQEGLFELRLEHEITAGWLQSLQNRQIISSREWLPGDPKLEFIHQLQIQTLLVLPIFTEDSWWGAIVLEQDEQVQPWSSQEMDVLQAAGNFFGLAIQHQQNAQTVILKEQERELEKSRILDNLTELVVFYDRSMQIVWANQVALDSVDLKIDSLEGRFCYQLWQNRDTPCEGCPVQLAIQTGVHQTGQMYSQDGRVWYIAASPMFNAQGAVVGAVESALDITARSNAEDRLRRRAAIEKLVAKLSSRFINLAPEAVNVEIQKSLRTMGRFVGSTHCFVLLLEEDGITVRERFQWHARGYKILPSLRIGASLEVYAPLREFFKHQGNLFIPDLNDSAEWDLEVFETWRVNHIRSAFIMPLLLDDHLAGVWGFLAQDNPADWRVDDLRLLKLMCSSFINVLKRKEAAEALRKERDFATGLVEMAQVIILVLDMQGCIVRFNPYFEQLSGYLLEEVRGKLWTEIFPPQAEGEGFWQKCERQMERSLEWQQIDSVLSRSGNEIKIEWRSRILKNSEVENIGILSTGRDITQTLKNEAQLRQANERLRTTIEELENRTHQANLLNEMGELFQSCQSEVEIYAVFSQFSGRLFPDMSGALYVYASELKIYKSVVVWGSGFEGDSTLKADACWALRLGNPYYVNDSQITLRCQHLGASEKAQSGPYICVPMIAQAEMMGLLHVCGSSWSGFRQYEQLVINVAEHITMALANLRLRERLKMQSIRDPLTGLFNRRYMDETIRRELLRASRHSTPVSILMIDIDRFKHYNDTYGHDAGDVLLQILGDHLKMHIRGSDVPCRYGGEEFVIILPDVELEEAVYRAEELREEIKLLKVRHRGRMLDGVTVSIGAACFPKQGKMAEELLRSADIALYRAKAEGRDRVVVAGFNQELR